MFKNVKFSLISFKLARKTPLYTPLLQPVCNWSADLNQANILFTLQALMFRVNSREGGRGYAVDFFICTKNKKVFYLHKSLKIVYKKLS